MRLIDADALLKAIANSGLVWETYECLDVIEVLVVKKLIDDAPTIEERPKGKWVVHNDYNENCRYGCNQCGNLTNRNSSFCPDCGERMEVEE